LDTISVTIRERIRIKGEVRAITAQVTLSGRFLGMMPIFLALGLWGLNRDYMEQFFSEPIICGIIMISTASLMLIFGFITLNKIADIEI
jgi:tight adherence protein B